MSHNSDLQATHQIMQFFEEAKGQTENILDFFPEVFAVIDSNGTILRGNQQMAALLKVEMEFLIDLKIDSIISNQNKLEFFEHLKRCQQKNSPIDFEMNLNGLQNDEKWFVWNIAPLFRSKKGSPDLFVVIGRDITKIKASIKEVARMENELTTAKTVQDMLFAPVHYEFDGGTVSGYYESATECGGDWWYYNTIGEKIYLWIGDVTGHGLSAAIITGAARAVVSLIESNPTVTPSHALSFLNTAVYATAKGKKLMSHCVAAINTKTGVCTYSTAGHPAPLLISSRSSQSGIKGLPAQAGSLLGLESDEQFFDNQVQLVPGDRLFFYTDGLYELNGPQSAMWGERKMIRALEKISQMNVDPKTFIHRFNEISEQHRQKIPLVDDVTYFLFQLK
jgi:PAS domain S-box-containing protein